MQEIDYKSAGHELEEQNIGLTFIHTPFCGTCHLARRMLTTIEVTYNRELFKECNASLHPDLMKTYQIKSVPCLLVTHQGEIVEKIYAFHSVPFMYDKLSEYVKK
ncbi:MAG: thioredoxin family protein [Halobacillus sp.]|uniref:thioredoxin family protein n=1 Tax=Halobacillus sp. TaxID=56800 RepID=UPI003BB12F7D